MSNKNKQPFDPDVMAELLAEPGVIEHVANMAPKEQDYFKELLYQQGIYSRYVLERQKKTVKQMLSDNFPKFMKAK